MHKERRLVSKKIAVVTATRAEFGLLSRLCHLIHESPILELQLFVTGAHLSASQGNTLKTIEAESLPITTQIPILTEHAHTDLDIAHATSRALQLFAEGFAEYKPDAVLVLGDRYELLGICSAALLMNIPIIHVHGGEVTLGAIDDSIRHAVTKMASLHFVAAHPYKQRVLQMGEMPERIYNVGSPGLDVIKHLNYLTKDALSEDLKLDLNAPLFLVTYHPETRSLQSVESLLNELFKALESFEDACVVWTAANTDAQGTLINQLVQAWSEKTNLHVKFVQSLGSQRYLSLMTLADVVVGNSSSGIIEAPALNTATVNIGKRQAGRLMAKSIHQADEDSLSIQTAIKAARNFNNWQGNSLYGEGNSAQAMINVLESTDFAVLRFKPFIDLTVNTP